mgnify:CR=1 FL=1
MWYVHDSEGEFVESLIYYMAVSQINHFYIGILHNLVLVFFDGEEEALRGLFLRRAAAVLIMLYLLCWYCSINIICNCLDRSRDIRCIWCEIDDIIMISWDFVDKTWECTVHVVKWRQVDPQHVDVVDSGGLCLVGELST